MERSCQQHVNLVDYESQGEEALISLLQTSDRVQQILNPFQNTRVTDWSGLVSHLHRTRSARLDLRRVVHANPRAPEETWRKVHEALAQAPSSLRRLELPRAAPADLCAAAAAVRHPLVEFAAGSIAAPAPYTPGAAAGAPEVDLASLASAPAVKSSLATLRLKTVSGKMRLAGGGLSPLGAVADTLTKLVSQEMFQ